MKSLEFVPLYVFVGDLGSWLSRDVIRYPRACAFPLQIGRDSVELCGHVTRIDIGGEDWPVGWKKEKEEKKQVLIVAEHALRERERELRDKRRTTYKFNKSLVTIPLAETNNPLVRRVSTRSWRKKHEDIRDTLVIVSRFSRLDIARNYVLKYIYIYIYRTSTRYYRG